MKYSWAVSSSNIIRYVSVKKYSNKHVATSGKGPALMECRMCVTVCEYIIIAFVSRTAGSEYVGFPSDEIPGIRVSYHWLSSDAQNE